jgi:hypothetical protein
MTPGAERKRRRGAFGAVTGVMLAIASAGLAPSTASACVAATEPVQEGGDDEECKHGAHPYAACMIARGYRVVVINFGTVDASVEAARPLTPEVVTSDLAECREATEARASALGGQIRTLVLASVSGPSDRLAAELDRVYAACLRPRVQRDALGRTLTLAPRSRPN